MAHCQMWWYIWIVWVQARCQRQRGAMLSGSCSWFQASYTPQHRGFVCRRSLTASSDQLQSCCLSKTVGTSQANKVHGFCPPPQKKEERIQPGGDNIIIFCQTCSRKSSFSRCRPTYHRLALIHFFGQTWCLLQCLSRGSLASEVDNTLRISYSFSFDSPECSPPLSWVLSPAQLSTKHLLQPS